MTAAKLSEDAIAQALDRNEGNKTAAARELGVTRHALRRKIKRLGMGTPPPTGVKPSDDGQSMVVTGQATNEDEIIAKYQVDTNIWESDKLEFREYWMPTSDGPILTPYIAVRFKRRVPFDLYEFEARLIESMRKSAPKRKLRHSELHSGEHLMCMPMMADPHFDKTGSFTIHDGYGLEQAERNWKLACDGAERRVAREKPERILGVFAGDFMNWDTMFKTTTKGTPQSDSSTNAHHIDVLDMAVDLSSSFLETMSQYAPVEVVLAPGNHDYLMMISLGRVLEARFENDENVTVEVARDARTYRRYGINLLGISHGDKGKTKDLPAAMSNEAAYYLEDNSAWNECLVRECHHGHLHSRGVIVDEKWRVTLRKSPALCGPDRYHSDNMLLSGNPGGTVYTYNRDEPHVLVDELVIPASNSTKAA